MPTQEEATLLTQAEQTSLGAEPESKPVQEAQVEQGPTAKEMAAAEEQNALRQKALSEQLQRQMEAAAKPEEPPMVSIAAEGIDALHAAIQARSNIPKEEYVPPPRTERQMTQLEAELAAGAAAQKRAQAQQDIANEARARAAAEERAKEGFTNPVYRPNDMVPDPIKGGMGPITQ